MRILENKSYEGGREPRVTGDKEEHISREYQQQQKVEDC